MPARSPALKVAAPCPLRWEDLAGNDRIRFCGQCQQNVYNVASLTAEEVRTMVQEREGRVCVRLQRRADGTVITRDCWYVVRRARQRLVAAGAGLVVAAAGFWGSVAFLGRLLGARRTPVAACPPPLPPRASLPELPDLEASEWPEKPVHVEQGERRPPRVRRPRKVRRVPVEPPEEMESATLGVMAAPE
jgi:hypothetical protein